MRYLLLFFTIGFFVCDHSCVIANFDEIFNFLSRVLRCIECLQTHPAIPYFTELEHHARTVRSITNVVIRAGGQGSEECIIVLESLYYNINLILQQFDSQILQDTENGIVPPTVHSGTAGRPRYDLTADQINHGLDLGYNWQGISSLFGIDRQTLFRHRQRLSIPLNGYSAMSDENLTLIIRQILENTPNAGETYVRGSLRSRALHIQQWRVRQILQEIDPVGRCFRRRQAIRRRIYSVGGPNELWYVIN